MKQMERKQHWESVYQQKQPDEVSWFQAHPHYSLKLIQASGIVKNQAIIDVGGGASRLVDKLLESGYQDVSVLDIAAAALEHAKTRLGKRAAHVSWLESDVTTFVPPRQYALWHDRAVFHFLIDANDRAQYLDILRRAVLPGGHVIIATFSPDGPDKCSNLPVERYDAEKLEKTLGADFSLQQTLSEVHQTPAAKIQHFLYFHLVKRADVEK
jgi:ubiquinone/menaquinone biosynthesis C-methylase UbiE